MNQRQLTVGVYETTKAFRQIEAHAAVMDAETDALICLVGRHDDENLKNAETIARVLNVHNDLLAACYAAENALRIHAGQGLPSPATGELLRNAIAKAEGRS